MERPPLPPAEPKPRGRGRPQVFEWTASRQRKLLRLYLCTDISPEVINKLVFRGGPIPSIKYTQNLLRQLLGEGFRDRRPTGITGKDASRKRIAYFKYLAKSRRRQKLHQRIDALRDDGRKSVLLEGNDAMSTMSRPASSAVSFMSMDDKKPSSLRKMIVGAFGQGRERTSSVFNDIESLLAASLRSSRISDGSSLRDSMVIQQKDMEWMPISSHPDNTTLNQELILACCLMSEDCIHRKLAEVINLERAHGALEPEAAASQLLPQDLQRRNGSEESAPHTAARWGASVNVLRQLLFEPAPSSPESSRGSSPRQPSRTWVNGTGETFLHVYYPSHDAIWGTDFMDLINELTTAGFPFNGRDVNGLTFLGAMVEHGVQPELVEGFMNLNTTWSRAFCRSRCRRGQQIADRLELRAQAHEMEGSHALAVSYTQLAAKLRQRSSKTTIFKESARLWSSKEILPCLTPSSSTNMRNAASFQFEDGGNLLHCMFSRDGLKSFYALSDTKTLPEIFEELVPMWIRHGVDINQYNIYGRTPVMELLLSASRDYLPIPVAAELMSLFLARGSNLYQKDREGNTVLHLAALHGLDPMLEQLIKMGSDVNIRNDKGRTALDLVGVAYRHSRAPDQAKKTASTMKSVIALLDHGGVGSKKMKVPNQSVKQGKEGREGKETKRKGSKGSEENSKKEGGKERLSKDVYDPTARKIEGSLSKWRLI